MFILKFIHWFHPTAEEQRASAHNHLCYLGKECAKRKIPAKPGESGWRAAQKFPSDVQVAQILRSGW